MSQIIQIVLRYFISSSIDEIGFTQAYYRDANIGDMEKTLEEKLKDPQNAQCRANDGEERRRKEEQEHAREESERFWRTVEQMTDWEIYHYPFHW